MYFFWRWKMKQETNWNNNPTHQEQLQRFWEQVYVRKSLHKTHPTNVSYVQQRQEGV